MEMVNLLLKCFIIAQLPNEDWYSTALMLIHFPQRATTASHLSMEAGMNS